MSAARPVEFGLAGPRDEAALKELLAESPIPGRIRMSFRREPDFFGALAVSGAHTDVILARDRATGAPAGLGLRSVKPAFVNGRRTDLGYLSGLRLRPEYRGGLALSRGYRFLRTLHRDGCPALYLTTIMGGNDAAQAVLTSARGGLPRYAELGRLSCFAIGSRQRADAPADPGLLIRPAAADDAPAIASFLEQEGPRRQFFPAYSEAEIRSGSGLLRGLRIGDILLARRGSRIDGTAALWDQSSFRQSRIEGYSPAMRLLLTFHNAAARLTGLPVLPPPGARVNAVQLALACVRGDDVATFAALLADAIRRLRERDAVLFAALHERDPLAPALRRLRHHPEHSRLYAVCWEDGEEALAGLDPARVPYLELGSL